MAYTRILAVSFGSTGLTSVGYQLKNIDGSNNGSRVTTGIVEIGAGYYQAYASIPDGFVGGVLWDTGEATPKYVYGDIDPLPELSDWLTQLKKTAEQLATTLQNPPSVINIHQPRDVFVPTAPTYGPVQIGNNIIVPIQHLLNCLYSSNFNDAELRKVNQEFHAIYDKLEDQQKAKLRDDVKKIIYEKAKNESGFRERLKEWGKRVAKEGWDISKGVLTNILTEYAKGL